MLNKSIPVMRPKLPLTDRVVPYLRKIDSTRIYSNYGPFALMLEGRLASHYGLDSGTVVTVANATLGLALALAALGARAGTLCLMPAWTFVASAHAARMAGLFPYFVDVAPGTWTIDPDCIAGAMTAAPAEVGAVMPVAPFGQPLDIEAWTRFHLRTGLPTVIDAAAGFDGLTAGAVPTVVSLHATKVLGVGEGGFVISTDASVVAEIRKRSNFGFAGSRVATAPSINAKLSEYHAAVGLAALDEWGAARSEWIALARAYREAMRDTDRLRLQDGFGENWITSTCMVRLPDSLANSAEMMSTDAGIETRRWWGHGAHAHPATAHFPRTPVPFTEILAESTIAVPFFRDLTIREIQDVCAVLHCE